MQIFFTLLSFIFVVSSVYAVDYDVDTQHSKVSFEGKHLFIVPLTGKFEKFVGRYSYDENKEHFTALSGKVYVASINTYQQSRDNLLKSEAFFDAKKYPFMTLVMLKSDRNSVLAYLTIKNVQKKILFDVQKAHDGFILRTAISRKNFKLFFHTLINMDMMVGDTIHIAIEMKHLKDK